MKLLKLLAAAVVVISAQSCCFAEALSVEQTVRNRLSPIIEASKRAGRNYLARGTRDGISGDESIDNINRILVEVTRGDMEGRQVPINIPAGNLSGANVNYYLGQYIAEYVWKQDWGNVFETAASQIKNDVENILNRASALLYEKTREAHATLNINAAKNDMMIWCSDTGFWDALAYLKSNIRTVTENDMAAIDRDVNEMRDNPRSLKETVETVDAECGEFYRERNWPEQKAITTQLYDTILAKTREISEVAAQFYFGGRISAEKEKFKQYLFNQLERRNLNVLSREFEEPGTRLPDLEFLLINDSDRELSQWIQTNAKVQCNEYKAAVNQISRLLESRKKYKDLLFEYIKGYLKVKRLGYSDCLFRSFAHQKVSPNVNSDNYHLVSSVYILYSHEFSYSNITSWAHLINASRVWATHKSNPQLVMLFYLWNNAVIPNL